jgi:hypothetical protein
LPEKRTLIEVSLLARLSKWPETTFNTLPLCR